MVNKNAFLTGYTLHKYAALGDVVKQLKKMDAPQHLLDRIIKTKGSGGKEINSIIRGGESNMLEALMKSGPLVVKGRTPGLDKGTNLMAIMRHLDSKMTNNPNFINRMGPEGLVKNVIPEVLEARAKGFSNGTGNTFLDYLEQTGQSGRKRSLARKAHRDFATTEAELADIPDTFLERPSSSYLLPEHTGDVPSMRMANDIRERREYARKQSLYAPTARKRRRWMGEMNYLDSIKSRANRKSMYNPYIPSGEKPFAKNLKERLKAIYHTMFNTNRPYEG